MGIFVNHKDASELLTRTLSQAEGEFRSVPSSPEYEITDGARIEQLFRSKTQVYREALLGCAVARCLDRSIDIRLPATEAGDDSFSGRSLAEKVVTPFLREHGIPALASTYLGPLRGGARFVPGGAPRIQRDQDGFDTLVSVVESLASASASEAATFLKALLKRFVELRETAKIALTQISRPNLPSFLV